MLGTPSTVATVSGEAFYYISQKAERAVSFMPTKITDQRVIAVYFDRDRSVQRLAEYGMKDGKVFDFVSQTTPTGGNDLNVITSIMNAVQGERIVTALLRAACRAQRPRQCASTASSNSATMLVILIIGLTAGPAVSLYGSPTVSPVTAALWASDPLPP